jgi:hypothetical protein
MKKNGEFVVVAVPADLCCGRNKSKKLGVAAVGAAVGNNLEKILLLLFEALEDKGWGNREKPVVWVLVGLGVTEMRFWSALRILGIGLVGRAWRSSYPRPLVGAVKDDEDEKTTFSTRWGWFSTRRIWCGMRGMETSGWSWFLLVNDDSSDDDCCCCLCCWISRRARAVFISCWSCSLEMEEDEGEGDKVSFFTFCCRAVVGTSSCDFSVVDWWVDSDVDDVVEESSCWEAVVVVMGVVEGM